MKKYSNIILLLCLVATVFGLFQIKYSVQYLQKDVAEMKRQVHEETLSIHVLKAEWAYLNHPKRLSILAKKYLTMQEAKIFQIFEYNEKTICSNEQKHNPNIKQVQYNLKKKTNWNFKDKNIQFKQH
jgi:cell division protein FtsL